MSDIWFERMLRQYVETKLATAKERIVELEASRNMFANQWALADRALVNRDARIAELEAAIDKLAQCKGRFHTEANFKALIEVRNKSLHK